MNKKIKIGLLFSAAMIAIFASVAAFYIKNAETELKLGFVTDWEYNSRKDIGNKLTNQAPAELEKSVRFMNERFKPEMVVAGGDMIESSGVSREKGQRQLEEVNAIFSRLNARSGYVFGNHDLRVFNKEDLRRILSLETNHSYLDLGDWRLVLADTNFNKKDQSDLGPDHYIGGYISQNEYAWLEEALATDRPTILFTHHSPIPNIDSHNLSKQEEARSFLEKFPNLILVVSGHDPTCKLEESNGVYYFIANNLVNRNALGSFATITAEYNKYTKKASVDIEHHGAHQEKFQIEKRFKYDEKWKNFLASFF